MPNLRSFFKAGGIVITIIGLIALPEDVGTWGSRLQDVGGMIRDNPLAGAAILVGLILLGLGYQDEVKGLFGKRKRWPSDKHLEDEVTRWLRDGGFSVVQQPSIPGVSFALTATSIERPVTIIRLEGSPILLFQTKIVPSDPHNKVIAAMGQSELDALKEELGLELARFGLNFDIQDILGEGIILNMPLVFSDALTRYQFIDLVNFVGRGLFLVQVIVSKHAREAQQRQGTEPAKLIPVPESTGHTAGSPTVSTS